VKVNFSIRLALVCSFMLGLSGCLGDGDAHKPGSAVQEEMAAPKTRFAASAPAKHMVRVFYGTNRSRDQSPSGWNEFYSASLDDLEVGICEVSIPENHEYGEVERPSIWKLEFSEDEDKHVVLQSIKPHSEEGFLEELASDVQRSARREAFVFIHGYNVTFAQAARRTAQMAHDLNFDGPPVFYSWPSQGSLRGYVTDTKSADASVRSLQQFLEGIAGHIGADEIHLIAHSMGNRVLTQAMDQMAEDALYRPVPKFNEILLAAPDIDAERFRTEIAPRIVDRSDRMTIYASSNDRALMASESLNRTRRLGQGGDELTLFPQLRNIDVIDATNVEFGWFDLGHSAYGDVLLEDIRQTLDGVPAPNRSLKQHSSSLAWLVPDGFGGDLVPVNHEVEADEPPVKRSLWSRIFFWW